MVGIHKVLVRDCDNQSELNLEIDVLENTPPYFIQSPDPIFKIAFGEIISYKLPPVEDSESNDIPQFSI